ncbi:hypothetical protein [Streptomyces tubercidicus]
MIRRGLQQLSQLSAALGDYEEAAMEIARETFAGIEQFTVLRAVP